MMILPGSLIVIAATLPDIMAWVRDLSLMSGTRPHVTPTPTDTLHVAAH